MVRVGDGSIQPGALMIPLKRKLNIKHDQIELLFEVCHQDALVFYSPR